jgi:hypothetical protein
MPTNAYVERLVNLLDPEQNVFLGLRTQRQRPPWRREIPSAFALSTDSSPSFTRRAKS